jgi:OmpA-OmpF porin, OOP family
LNSRTNLSATTFAVRAGLTLLALAAASLATGCAGVVQASNPSPISIAGDPPNMPAPPVAAPPVLATLKRVQIVKDHVVINEKIQFENGKATIKPESNSLLDEIAGTVKTATFLKKLEVQGHASAEGDAVVNTRLSDDRAKSVAAALVQRGVRADILVAKGYGASKPIADNTTEAGRDKNRRVEFLILDPMPK